MTAVLERSLIDSIIRNKVDQYETGAVPILKVRGFDGYDFANLGITDQFLANAERYYDVYTNPAHFRDLYGRALSITGGKHRRILDIGTGGGNSIFALFELLGKVEAVGVDLSPQLLRLCAREADVRYGLNGSDLTLLCADLYDIDVIPESVDLVTGSAILHHMMDPAYIVDLALKAIRLGGWAIFAEPMELGHGLLCGVYRTILELEPRLGQIQPEIRRHLLTITQDYDARKGIGHVRKYTRDLDDKWFFTEGWFRKLAEQHGCKVTIVSTHGINRFLWRQFEVMCLLDNGADPDALPDWAKDIFAVWDNTFSIAQSAEICFGGLIVLEKP